MPAWMVAGAGGPDGSAPAPAESNPDPPAASGLIP
jgi:hypothetical protein